MTDVIYTTRDATTRLRLKGDPFEVCDAVARGLGLGVRTADPVFDQIMRRRAEQAEADRRKQRKASEENLVPRRR